MPDKTTRKIDSASLSGPITGIVDSLESLRDFVDVLDSHLAKKSKDHMLRNESFIIPLMLAMHDASVDSDLGLKPMEQARVDALRQRSTASASEAIDVKKTEDGVSIKMRVDKDGQHGDVREVLTEIFKASKRSRMLYSSALMNLASSIELFFSRTLHQFFLTSPNSIGTKEKVFSFDDLNQFETVDAARAHYVLAKIEDLLRGSLGDWLNFAKANMGLSLGYLEDLKETLDEVFQRRNLIVHNDGMVNSIYLTKVKASARSGVAKGDDLTPDREYLNRVIDIWEKSCILIASELWKKLYPADETRGDLLLGIGYKHLLAQRWLVSEGIYAFLIADKKIIEGVRVTALINYWLCKKKLDQWDSVASEVEAADFSAKTRRFQIALLALRGENDRIFKALPGAIRAGELSKEELLEFPIFEDIRKDPRYEKYRPSVTSQLDDAASLEAVPDLKPAVEENQARQRAKRPTKKTTH